MVKIFLQIILVRVAALLASLGMAWSCFMGVYLLKGREKISERRIAGNNPPDDPEKISLIIPAKNEGPALERLLEKLVRSDYPNYEIILVEGGSTDETPDICEKYRKIYPDLIKLVEDQGEGKPAALNLGLEESSGEIIGVLDADSYPIEDNFLQRISAEFRDGEIAALQGKISLISPEDGLASKLSNFSRYLPLPYLIKGKKRVGGFIPLFGTHQYLRRSVLEEIGGWDEEALTEDIDLSLELHKRDEKVQYSLVEVQEEPPASFKSFLKQNVRHARGMIQSLFKHLRDLSLSKIKGWDAIITLFSPLIVSLGLIGFLIIVFEIPFLLKNEIVLGLIMLVAGGFVLGFARSRYSEESKISHAPWMFLLWIVQSGIGIFAFLAEILRLPRAWNRTEKEISKLYES